MNLDAQAIRHESHDARRFHPRNLFQLQFALGKGNEKNVAADIFAHHFHDVRVRDVLSAANFDLIAGIDAKTPRALSVTVEAQAGGSENRKSKERHGDSLQPIGSLLRNGSAPGRDSLLSAQKWGFLLCFQIDEPCVVEGLALESPMLRNIAGKRIQLFLYRAGTCFPRHSFESVVDRKPLSKVTMSGFRELRQCQVGSATGEAMLVCDA